MIRQTPGDVSRTQETSTVRRCIVDKCLGSLRATILIVSMVFLVLFTGSCEPEPAYIIARAIAELPVESSKWRSFAEERTKNLPPEIREQVDLAFSRAVAAAGAEFRCDADFIRARLLQDLERVRARLVGQEGPTTEPHVCQILPKEVIELDRDLIPRDQTWISFVGYDLDRPEVRILLEPEQGPSLDLSDCCLDNPTHYILTVDLDRVDFAQDSHRLILKWDGGERTVAINFPAAQPGEIIAVIGPFGGPWGEWRSQEMCPHGTFAFGFAHQVEGKQGSGDDTALNGIRLRCGSYPDPGQTTAGLATSGTGIWGDWSEFRSCEDDFVTAVTMRIEDWQKEGDDTAAVDIQFRCRGGTVLSVPPDLDWGKWKAWQECPDNTAICGIQTKVEPRGGGNFDDTALNDAKFVCCSFD